MPHVQPPTEGMPAGTEPRAIGQNYQTLYADRENG
jgi:hypothetical protein